jgi:hypothetical protein
LQSSASTEIAELHVEPVSGVIERSDLMKRDGGETIT